MHGYQRRSLETSIAEELSHMPAVALLGPRQSGKTTLARHLIESRGGTARYLDLERPTDLRKLDDAELFVETLRTEHANALLCLDEIQRVPELFPVLRGLIDRHGGNGQFLILGSASRDLIRQTSESLAGRISLLELTPFLVNELDSPDLPASSRRWLRGGFPRSFLAEDDHRSYRWRQSFVQTFLERDIPQLGFDIPAPVLHRLWRMLSHQQGHPLNAAKLGAALGVDQKTVRRYVDLLAQTFMIRLLEPAEANTKKRLVKSPKVYVRDSGLLHALLEIATQEELLGHPIRGMSWEGLVIENVIAALPWWRPSFYRTNHGAEIDLVMSRGQRTIAIECKASTAPSVSRGFWTSLEDVGADEAWIVAPVDEPYPIRENVRVTPLLHLVEYLRAREAQDS